MARFARGAVVLAPFPYSDLTGSKRRPGCIVSSDAYNEGPDVVLAMVTSSAARLADPGLGDVVLRDWRVAGLLRPSVLRAGRLLVLEPYLLSDAIGALTPHDILAAEVGLRDVLGLRDNEA